MDKKRIDVGDIVDIYFEHISNEYGVRVLYTPQDTGDSWSFEREDGTIIYVCFYSKMVRKERKI